MPELQPLARLGDLNLGSSIPVFAVLLLAWFITLQRLHSRLGTADAADGTTPGTGHTNHIVQLDHLTDIWTALFFGTGVIWTAIGMRGALIYALGDPDATLQQGAFAILERMVNGGILLALSTTIFGGVGGYLMRVYKALTLGAQLQRHYDQAVRIDAVAMRDSLVRIERHLEKEKVPGLFSSLGDGPWEKGPENKPGTFSGAAEGGGR